MQAYMEDGYAFSQSECDISSVGGGGAIWYRIIRSYLTEGNNFIFRRNCREVMHQERENFI